MATAEGKRKKMTLLALSVFLALLFLLAGGSKLFAPEMHFKDFQEWGYPIWFIFVVGAIEVAGAALLLIPYRSHFPSGDTDSPPAPPIMFRSEAVISVILPVAVL